MAWKDIMKRELLQGPAEASSYYYENRPKSVFSKENHIWEIFYGILYRSLPNSNSPMHIKKVMGHNSWGF